MFKKALLLIMCCLWFGYSFGQTRSNAGWFFLTHSQKISKKFDLLADVQLRSADQYKYLSTLLLRGGINYNFNKKHSVALGYVYKADWMHEPGEASFTLEHRIFEQYMYEFKLKHTELNIRARLEQRFVKEEDVKFSQRGRLFLSATIPVATDTAFTKGLFIGLQNELFVNMQNKEVVNNCFFDQNRPYGSVGYRWNKHLDTEAGYMYWFQKQMDGDYRNHIFQITVTTKF